VTDGLAHRVTSDTHGQVEPVDRINVEAFQAQLAATRDGWEEDETLLRRREDRREAWSGMRAFGSSANLHALPNVGSARARRRARSANRWTDSQQVSLEKNRICWTDYRRTSGL
jgi:hypothetical protein